MRDLGPGISIDNGPHVVACVEADRFGSLWQSPQWADLGVYINLIYEDGDGADTPGDVYRITWEEIA